MVWEGQRNVLYQTADFTVLDEIDRRYSKRILLWMKNSKICEISACNLLKMPELKHLVQRRLILMDIRVEIIQSQEYQKGYYLERKIAKIQNQHTEIMKQLRL
ncbi:hypothetical protein AVEN_73279-1 [Araneus ventricosus]|uniref:Uncharacterized protein n=1 Tax=Araneus ventricosus TaxID=182803 RepID=A0A4Y2VE90_ARAVE|nr:hypothetical protein AVEN_73279-1 [Araneus ventricosus]